MPPFHRPTHPPHHQPSKKKKKKRFMEKNCNGLTTDSITGALKKISCSKVVSNENFVFTKFLRLIIADTAFFKRSTSFWRNPLAS